ncbi:MAG TPA: hypothetical protein VNA69_05385 [Thermoanaerobaculia bacterium]|nr:hypothetical protein [Thermoanaerobaculia bacterium]
MRVVAPNNFIVALSIAFFSTSAAAAEIVLWQDGPESGVLQPLKELDVEACDVELSCPQTLLVKRFGPRVTFRERTYDVSRAGLYRFMSSSDDYFRTVLSYPIEYPPLTILRGLAALHVHGEPVYPLPFDPALLVSTTPYAVLTCGSISYMATRVLADLRKRGDYKNVLTRDVHTCIHPAVAPNGYNDGHVMIEITNDTKSWILVDLDAGYLFRDRRSGAWLSAKEFLQAVQTDNRPDFVPLARKAALVDPHTSYNGYFYAPEFNMLWGNEAALWTWYRRNTAVFSTTGTCPPVETPSAKQMRAQTNARVSAAARPLRRAPGSWVNVVYDGALFTASNGGLWKVEPDDVGRLAWTTIGKTMMVSINLDYTSVNGNPQYLQFKVPGGLRAVGQHDDVVWAKNASDPWMAAPVAVVDDTIRFYRGDYLTAWTDAEHTTHVRATIAFETQ